MAGGAGSHGRVPRRAPLDDVASVVQRLAVLLAAGVAPASAWGYLPASGMASAVSGSAGHGGGVAQAIAANLAAVPAAEAAAWSGLAAAWQVATDAGAPLAPALRDFAASLRSLANAQRDIAVALAAPVATAKMVMALPVVGVLFGMVLGFNTLETLFTTPVGFGCLVVGGGLLLAAAGWSRRLVRSAQPTHITPGLRFELMAIAVSGGGSLDRATACVSAAIAEHALENDSERDGVDAVLDLSRRAGVPAAELLRSEAEEARRISWAEAERRASVLAVRLMLPLGLCILPAFMVLSVVPLLVAVISSTVATF